MRRKVFQDTLPDALSIADGIVIGPVNRPESLSDDERLSPAAVAESLRQRGRTAGAFASSAEVVEYLLANLKPGDLVMVMSNGSFDGLSAKLLDALASLSGGRR
jgi:UDP-N-acetylmuramate: L-alanyl-gamma-D-glutamyl-meso-diaminopimelate ligase